MNIPPSDYKKILAISDDLPALQKLDKSGKPLSRVITKYNGGKTYQKINDPILVNHTIEMCSTFVKKGWNGVNIYVDTVKRIYAESTTTELHK